LDDVLGLLLGADEQHRAAGGGEIAREVESGAKHLHGLLQIDNVNTVAGAEDVLLHLRVPAAGLMAEVNAGLQKLLHADFSHRILSLPLGPTRSNLELISGRHVVRKPLPLRVHRLEEFLVGLGLVHLVDQEFHRFDRVELGQQLAQYPDAIERGARQQQLFLARRGALDVDGRENALFQQTPVQRYLLIAGALELFEDDLVHAAAGIDQRRRDNCQAAAVLGVARGAEKLLGLVQRVGIDAARQDLARRRHYGVVGAREPRDRVEQDDDVAPVLDQPPRLFDYHLGHLHVTGGRLVEGRADDLALHRAQHVGDFLGPLIDQQHDQHDLGMVVRDRLGDRLQHHGLAGERRRDDKSALAFADRRDQIDDAGGQILVIVFELDALLGIERGEVVEQDLVARLFRVLVVDRFNLEQREVALAFFWRANQAGNHVAGAQIELANLARRNINVVGAGQVVVVRSAQEAEAVGQNFQHALAEDRAVLGGLRLQDRKNHLLLAHVGGAIDVEVARHLRQLGYLRALERLEVEYPFVADHR